MNQGEATPSPWGAWPAAGDGGGPGRGELPGGDHGRPALGGEHGRPVPGGEHDRPARGADRWHQSGEDPWKNPYAMGGHEKHIEAAAARPAKTFDDIQKANDQARAKAVEDELKEKVKNLENLVEKLSTLATQAQTGSDRGSSAIRVRRTAQERTQEWLKKHGVQGISSSASVGADRAGVPRETTGNARQGRRAGAGGDGGPGDDDDEDG